MDVRGSLYRFSLWAVPLFFRFLSVLIFSTCRVEYRHRERFDGLVKSGKSFIVSFWHYGVIYIVYQARDVPYVAMVSASKDGEYVSRILQSKGFATVRGSRNKGAIAAMKGVMREVKKGKTAVLVADGSQGPARKAQSGSILLAGRAGVPVLPMAWSASSYKTFRSWDRTALPMPFSRIIMSYGEPIEVPSGIGSEDVEQYRLQLERSLDEIYVKCWAEFGREGH